MCYNKTNWRQEDRSIKRLRWFSSTCYNFLYDYHPDEWVKRTFCNEKLIWKVCKSCLKAGICLPSCCAGVGHCSVDLSAQVQGIAEIDWCIIHTVFNFQILLINNLNTHIYVLFWNATVLYLITLFCHLFIIFIVS